MTADEQPQYVTGPSVRLWRKADPEEKKLLEVKAKYRDYLFSFPGVVGLGVGLVQEGDQFTKDRAIIVHVDIDRPPEQLDVIDRIPSELDGCPVQVIEEEEPKELGAPNLRHRPLQGGLGRE